MAIRFRAGFHLGNWGSGPDSASIDLIKDARPQALLAMDNIQPSSLEFWAEANCDGYLILRKHFDHKRKEKGLPTKHHVAKWAAGQREMVDKYLAHGPFHALYEAGRMGVKVFNEPNFEDEGFGQDEDALKAYNDLFPAAAHDIKSHFPKINVIGYSLAPGNKDVYFHKDNTNVHYWLHGPEAAKDNPSQSEIEAATESCLTRDASAAMDWFGCHIYPDPNTWDQPRFGTRFERYWKFLPQRLRERTFILECSVADKAGQNERARQTEKWLRLVQDYPDIRGITLWWLRPGDGTWERQFYTEQDGARREVAATVINFNNRGQTLPLPTRTSSR